MTDLRTARAVLLVLAGGALLASHAAAQQVSNSPWGRHVDQSRAVRLFLQIHRGRRGRRR